jgi:hypothetical protein
MPGGPRLSVIRNARQREGSASKFFASAQFASLDSLSGVPHSFLGRLADMDVDLDVLETSLSQRSSAVIFRLQVCRRF